MILSTNDKKQIAILLQNIYSNQAAISVNLRKIENILELGTGKKAKQPGPISKKQKAFEHFDKMYNNLKVAK